MASTRTSRPAVAARRTSLPGGRRPPGRLGSGLIHGERRPSMADSVPASRPCRSARADMIPPVHAASRSRCGASSSASPASSPTTRSTSTCGVGEVHALLGENGAGKSHAHEHPGRPLPAGRGRDRACGGQPVDLRLAARRHRGRPRHGPPALHAGAVADRHRERPARAERAALPARAPASTTSEIAGLGERHSAAGRPDAPRSGSSRSASSSASRSSRCSTAAPAS